MHTKVPVRVDGRFRLGDILGSGSYAVVYRARNIIKEDAVAIKLEPISHSSSVQREYKVLKHLEGGVGIPRVHWFGRESTYHALVLNLLGPSLHDLFLTHNNKFSLETVVNLGDQLVS
ncbi:kinase-like domain-containing protein [Suillus plorans]|uniref:Kinase-like domain-containing protein n=1 Tax=Suillus plorans TaxID=116603 RepID=A0A9P7DF02_9AGAM|nr:kinase-like domain-containing protein [Suillus plorans]KAG1790768.1 kinase-like domain-containing protein [Suillus plorans]